MTGLVLEKDQIFTDNDFFGRLINTWNYNMHYEPKKYPV